MIVGSPGYMAPEQWRGADPDARADIYSVGRVGITMLTGVRPPAEDADVDLVPHRSGEPGHDALLDLLGRAVSRDPEHRPPTAAAMRAELQALDLTSRPPEPGEDITVEDAFGDVVTLANVPRHGRHLPAHPPPPWPRPVGPPRCWAPTRPGCSTGRRPAGPPYPGVALLAVGLASLVAAVLLLLL